MANPQCEYCGLEHNMEIDYFRCNVDDAVEKMDGRPIFHFSPTRKTSTPSSDHTEDKE